MRARELAHWPRACTAFAEDLSSAPSIHISHCSQSPVTPAPKDLTPSFLTPKHLRSHAHTDIQAYT